MPVLNMQDISSSHRYVIHLAHASKQEQKLTVFYIPALPGKERKVYPSQSSSKGGQVPHDHASGSIFYAKLTALFPFRGLPHTETSWHSPSEACLDSDKR